MLLIPFSEFEPLIDGMWITQKDDRHYWHVVIYRKGEEYTLHRKKGEKNVDLTQYFVGQESSVAVL